MNIAETIEFMFCHQCYVTCVESFEQTITITLLTR